MRSGEYVKLKDLERSNDDSIVERDDVADADDAV
jgi:hypothetical protein